MKSVDAVWERKNLGLGVLELELGAGDADLSGLESQLRTHAATHDYFLVKIPAGSARLVQGLEDRGFRFLETRVGLCRSAEGYASPAAFAAMTARMSCARVEDDAGMEAVLAAMDEEMFVADRISQDPALGPAQALARYRNWIRTDFKKKDKHLYRMKIGRREFGFFTMSMSEGTMHILLGGTYTPDKGKGLGMGVIHLPLTAATASGATLCATAASSNNLSVINLYMAFGYRVDALHYVLRLHETARH